MGTLDLDLGVNKAVGIQNRLSHDIVKGSLGIDGAEEVGGLVASSEVLVTLESSKSSKLALIILFKSGLREKQRSSK